MDIKWNYKLLDYGQTFIATLTVKEKIECCTASENTFYLTMEDE